MRRGDREAPTPHEQRIAEMTTRERLIFRLIRRIAILSGAGKAFDAECDRLAASTLSELHEETRRKVDLIRKQLEETQR